MIDEIRLRTILNSVSHVISCTTCETRLRFGDHECPHCGKDVDDELHAWAEGLLRALEEASPEPRPKP